MVEEVSFQNLRLCGLGAIMKVSELALFKKPDRPFICDRLKADP